MYRRPNPAGAFSFRPSGCHLGRSEPAGRSPGSGRGSEPGAVARREKVAEPRLRRRPSRRRRRLLEPVWAERRQKLRRMETPKVRGWLVTNPMRARVPRSRIPVLLHLPTKRGVGHPAACRVAVLLEVHHLRDAGDRARHRRVRETVLEEELGPAAHLDLGGPLGQLAGGAGQRPCMLRTRDAAGRPRGRIARRSMRP